MDVTDKAAKTDPQYDEHDDDDDVSTAPFAQQTAFGRGLWKRPIAFVPAGSASKSAPSVNLKGKAVADAYRAIVFGESGPPKPELDVYPLCGTCGAPIKESDDKAHYLSHVHQAALPRAPIPSGIDRTRMGLKYLEKHGFDIDARVGLGANGQGRLFPIVPRERRDKVGLGVDLKRIELEKKEALTPKNVTLDAGKVRKLAKEQKKKHESLQKMLYGDDKVEAYFSGRGHVDHGLR